MRQRTRPSRRLACGSASSHDGLHARQPNNNLRRRTRVMQTTSIKNVLSALFVVCSLSSQAQVYSVLVGSTVGGGTLVYQLDHEWLIGVPPNLFRLVQCRRSNGTSDAPLITYTTVHFLSRQFTVQMPAMSVAAIGLIIAASLVWFAIAAGSRIRKPCDGGAARTRLA